MLTHQYQYQYQYHQYQYHCIYSRSAPVNQTFQFSKSRPNQNPKSIQFNYSLSLFTQSLSFPFLLLSRPSLYKLNPFPISFPPLFPNPSANPSRAVPQSPMDVAPPVEKRQLRQRKPPAAASPPPEDLDSDEEIRGRSKRRKTASRSVKKQPKVAEVEPELTQTAGKGKVTASAKTNPKARAKSAKANGKTGEKNNGKKKSKKQSRSVVKGDVGGVEMEEEEDDGDEGLTNEEEEEDAQEAAGAVPEKKVRVAQSSRDAPDAVLVGDPIDDAVARKKWPHRYWRKVYFLPF